MSWTDGENLNQTRMRRLSQALPTSYTVWKDGSTFRAESNLSGGTDYSGLIANTVLQSVASNLTSGGTIFIRNGDYRGLTTETLTLASGTRIVGESREGTILGSTGGAFTIYVNGKTDVSIENLKISGARATTDMYIYIYGTTPARVQIRNVHFAGQTTWAVNIAAASDVTVEHCICDSANIAQFIYSSAVLTRGKILFNKISDTTSSAIGLDCAIDCKILGNDFIDPVDLVNGGAIVIFNSDGTSQNNRVIGNTIRFTTNPTNVVNGIIISGEGSDTYYNENTIIANNTIISEAGITGSNVNAGIYLHGYDGTHHQVRNCTVNSNTILGLGRILRAIVSSMADEYNITGNTIKTTYYDGVLIDDADIGYVGANKIYGWNGAAGAYLGINTSNAPSGLVIGQNAGYITVNSGTSTGTGGQQTIAHGLSTTPNRVYLTDLENGAAPYQSAAADATNIYVTATVNQDYTWKAEVV